MRVSTARRSWPPSMPRTYSAASTRPSSPGWRYGQCAAHALRHALSSNSPRRSAPFSSFRAARPCAPPVAHRSPRRGTRNGWPATSSLQDFAQAHAQPRLLLRLHHHVERAGGGVPGRLRGLVERRAAEQTMAPDRSRSIAQLRAMATSQVEVGLARSGLKRAAFAPHRHIDVLQHVLGLASVPQDTEQDAKSFAEEILIDDPQRSRSPGAGTHQGRGKLSVRRLRPSLLRPLGRLVPPLKFLQRLQQTRGTQVQIEKRHWTMLLVPFVASSCQSVLRGWPLAQTSETGH